MVQEEAVFGHEGVVQDKVYVNTENNVAAVADGVSLAGMKSALTASELAKCLSESLAEAIKTYGNNYEETKKETQILIYFSYFYFFLTITKIAIVIHFLMTQKKW